MLYFAYGSNMKTERLVSRVGEVKILGRAVIEDYQLSFNKLGDNGSGKANIYTKNDSSVEGALFDLTEEQIKKLDRHEGVNAHYIRCTRDIKLDGKILVAEVYFANQDKLQDNLRPTCEYLQHIIDGAEEHGLDSNYRKFLKSFQCSKIPGQQKLRKPQ